MLAMGGEGDLIDRLMEMNIAPLAISYEYDPCDFLKAQEDVYKRQTDWLPYLRSYTYTPLLGEKCFSLPLAMTSFPFLH